MLHFGKCKVFSFDFLCFKLQKLKSNKECSYIDREDLAHLKSNSSTNVTPKDGYLCCFIWFILLCVPVMLVVVKFKKAKKLNAELQLKLFGIKWNGFKSQNITITTTRTKVGRVKNFSANSVQFIISSSSHWAPCYHCVAGRLFFTAAKWYAFFVHISNNHKPSQAKHLRTNMFVGMRLTRQTIKCFQPSLHLHLYIFE